MKSNPYEHLLNHDVLKGGLLTSLIGLLPSIGTGAFYLIENLAHGIDFATGGRMGENRISAMISILNLNTLWLPLTGFLLLVPAVRSNRPSALAIVLIQVLGAFINFSRGLYTEAALELVVGATALLCSPICASLSIGLGDTDE